MCSFRLAQPAWLMPVLDMIDLAAQRHCGLDSCQLFRAVVFKLFVPKAHQRASQNLKAHLYSYPCKIASITCVITL